MAWPNASAHNL